MVRNKLVAVTGLFVSIALSVWNVLESLILNVDLHEEKGVEVPMVASKHFFRTVSKDVPRTPIPAVRVWKQYKTWHSQESLLLSWNGSANDNNYNRAFVVGYYSCPLQAGNRIHDFLNSLITAVVTNRTFLWKYMDEPTCSRVRMGYTTTPCKHNTTEQDCAKVLQRSRWIPSFDEWAPRFNLPHEMGPRNPDYFLGATKSRVWSPSGKTLKQLHRERRKVGDMTELEKYPSKPSWFVGPVIQTSREWFLDEQVTEERMKRVLLDEGLKVTSSSIHSQILKDLYSEGTDFLYGMLFHDTFTYLGGPILEHTSEAKKINRNDTLSLVIHSRHQKSSDKGSNTKREQECLKQVIQQLRKENGPQKFCTVFIMSDRLKTVNALEDISQSELGCTAVVAEHVSRKGLTSEHGPFAGEGFFQDLYYGSLVRDGVIGNCNNYSSFELLRASIVFKRTIESWKLMQHKAQPILSSCCLK